MKPKNIYDYSVAVEAMAFKIFNKRDEAARFFYSMDAENVTDPKVAYCDGFKMWLIPASASILKYMLPGIEEKNITRKINYHGVIDPIMLEINNNNYTDELKINEYSIEYIKDKKCRKYENGRGDVVYFDDKFITDFEKLGVNALKIRIDERVNVAPACLYVNSVFAGIVLPVRKV